MRCPWSNGSDLLLNYHDNEWGKPIYDEQKIFEILCLELMQSGLSWQIILKKRDAFKKAFLNFNTDKVAQFNDKKIEELMNNKDIVRNRKKIEAIVSNAVVVKKLHRQNINLSDILWKYTSPIVNHWELLEQIPTQTVLSQTIASDLKKLGFKFLGPVTVYSLMQAIGIVNDHLIGCEFR